MPSAARCRGIPGMTVEYPAGHVSRSVRCDPARDVSFSTLTTSTIASTGSLSLQPWPQRRFTRALDRDLPQAHW